VAGGTYFWPGIAMAYAGILWLLGDWWFFSKELAAVKRIAGVTATLAIAAVVSWVAFRPAPLGVVAIAENTKYEDGSIIDGIIWRDRYYPLKLIIDNTSGDSYHDLEMLVRTDVIIKDIWFNGEDKCSFKATLPGILIAHPETTITTPDGKSVTKPINMNAGSVFRVSCEKLSASSVLEIVAALVPKPPNPGRLRSFPSWVIVDATYTAFGRPEKLSYRKCLVESCKNMPKLISDTGAGVLDGNEL